MKRNEVDAAVDLIVVGAGPAGIGAATEASRHGLRTVLLDENPSAGGRIWQGLPARGASNPEEAAACQKLADFTASGVETLFEASVWGIEPDGVVFLTKGGRALSLRARHILLATGTTERPMPIPGVTLPGVMTVGAAQIAWKTSLLLPDEHTWIAGQGPLIYLYAAQVIQAGGRLGGILSVADPKARWRALRHVPAARSDIIKGLGWLRALRGIPQFNVSDIRAEGDRALREVSFLVNGSRRVEKADLLLLHDGVIPSTQLTRAIGCDHHWDELRHCWQPSTNEWGETTVAGLIVAGDGAGIGGATAAFLSGQIAAIGCTDKATRDAQAAPLREMRGRALASRPFIDTLYVPLPVVPADTTMICRCEEVTAGDIRAAAKSGCLGLNQLKAYTRCGMGPCQGRMCGVPAGEVLARAHGWHPRDVEPFRTRFPAKPLTVGELASLAES